MNRSSIIDTPNERLPINEDYYESIKILDNHPHEFCRKWGEGVLHSLDVQLVRVYADNKRRKPRKSSYHAYAGYRTDDDNDAQTDLPVVSHSDAVFTSIEAEGTATRLYFENPIRAGFPTVNVGPKMHPGTLSLNEMADDKLAITNAISSEMGLGLEPDENGIIEIAVTGYSRGAQIGIVATDRANLQGMKVSYLHGVLPGPRNKETKKDLTKRILAQLPYDLATLAVQAWQDPRHAMRNSHILPVDPIVLQSYLGDTNALHTGDVGDAMIRISRDTRGHIITAEHDSFGRYNDYKVDFESSTEQTVLPIRPFSDLRLIQVPGSHFSGTRKQLVKFDRDSWQKESEHRTKISQKSPTAG
ncbi:MAG: hypothetical protein WAW80_01195 [Candidatus Saccharimonadales bacterium]